MIVAGHGWICIFPLLLPDRYCTWFPREFQPALLAASFLSGLFPNPFFCFSPPLLGFLAHGISSDAVRLDIAQSSRKTKSRESPSSLRLILDAQLLNVSALFWENWSYKNRETLVSLADILVYSNDMINQETTRKPGSMWSHSLDWEERFGPLFFPPQTIRTSLIVWEKNNVSNRPWSYGVQQIHLWQSCPCNHKTITSFCCCCYCLWWPGADSVEWASGVSLIPKHSIPWPRGINWRREYERWRWELSAVCCACQWESLCRRVGGGGGRGGSLTLYVEIITSTYSEWCQI